MVFVNPCQVQKGEDRFGASAAGEIRDSVLGIPGDDHTPDPVAGHGSRPGVPRVSHYRMNLTALSQKHNLYFCAYQNEIHVFQPEREPRILKPPCLVLHPPASNVAVVCGGYISPAYGHQINHLITGMFGDLEILLFNYDDGDVIAIYTHTIACYVKAISKRGRRVALPPFPKPFFHQNVGKTAWGLAIHQASRLIAVSSNAHEVTVFALATNAAPDAVKPIKGDASPRLPSGLTALELERHFRSRTRTWRILLPLGQGSKNIPAISFCDDADGNAFQVVAVDVGGSTWFLNIWDLGVAPLTLPELRENCLPVSPAGCGWGVLVLSDASFRPTSKGPSLAPGKLEKIACKRFLGVHGILHRTEAPGATIAECRHMDFAAKSVDDVVSMLLGTYAEASDAFPWMFSGEDDGGDDDGDDVGISDEGRDKGSDSRHSRPQTTATATATATHNNTLSTNKARWHSLEYGRALPYSKINDLYGPYRVNRIIVPAVGDTPAPILTSSVPQFLRFIVDSARGRKVQMARLTYAGANHFPEPFPRHLAENCCIFRTTGTDVELQPIDFGPRTDGRPAMPAVFRCRDVLPLTWPRNGGGGHLQNNSFNQGPPDMVPNVAHRISMLAHVPELNLVVAGSLGGRVALITLVKKKKMKKKREAEEAKSATATATATAATTTASTSTSTKQQQSSPTWQRGFRIDGVLPRVAEEEHRQVRPWCPLIGLAVSPVPGSWSPRTSGADPGPRRFRLILHYMNHDILMYQLTRRDDASDAALMVV